jgi:CYTH domain-containing protein
MGIEIERKYLIKNDLWRKNAKGSHFRQGYIVSAPHRTVRIRTCDKKGFLTIKGMAKGIVRPEFEYEIPFQDADFLLENFCEKPILEKIRYQVKHEGLTWEIDEFLGENLGLFVAEIELTNDAQVFQKPLWVGEEVTGDARYFNSSLYKSPFKDWAK